MAEPYRSDQGTIIPSLFIGMGGTGSRIVDRIAARASRLPNWEAQLKPLTSFISIDTNKLDQNQLKFIPQGNRILIGAFDKQTVVQGYTKSHNVQALQWLDPAYSPRKGVKPGAGQIRVESRLGFFYNSPFIHERLKQIVNATLAPGITWRQSNPRNYNVYLYSTLAGGTGSGSFLSMSYLVQKVIRDTNEWQPRVVANLLLSTLLLDVVGKDLHPDIHANTYAALKELEHMTKLNYKQERDTGRHNEPFAYWNDENASKVPEVDSAPFFLGFIYDRPANFSLPNMESAVADAAFLQVFTPNIANMASALDNYEKHLEELTRFPGDLKNVGKGYAKNFGAMGAAALVLPAADLLEYCALRFAAEAVRSQITFGVDSEGATDDRARAMARLAVNYGDPRFLAMGEEGRDRTINDSFIQSVREMARQDERQELKDGFWYQLVESTDEGRVTGTDDKGVPQRAESLLALVRRKFDEQRRPLMTKVSIKDRAFAFYKESVNQYPEYVGRLKEEIRSARLIVEQGMEGLKRSAAEGETVAELGLDPITERYLILRLLNECETKWIPAAQKQFDAARQKDIGDAKVADRLEEEYRSLQQAAQTSTWAKMNPFNKDDAFLAARDQAQDYYRSVGLAAGKLFDAEVQLSQFREFFQYLNRRARQYARLARHMNSLVMDLEGAAENLRKGQGGEPKYALAVEIFETLEEPRERIWGKVYKALYVDEGRYLSTFDRNTLAKVIGQELRPKVRPDGMVEEKGDDELLTDIRDALIRLGRQKLSARIFGEGNNDWGMDLNSGLTLEARLMIAATKMPGETIKAGEIDAYMDKKFRALTQICGVLARVRSGEWSAFDDGVKVDRTRYLTHGFGGGADATRVPKAFLERLTSMLATDGRAVVPCYWHDPRIAIVYDVELPIPLYYISPITDEIEAAYVKRASEKKSYNLHTDKRWEESLTNLNPKSSELSLGWSVQKLAQGLVTGVIEQSGSGEWVWYPAGQPQPEKLGNMIAIVLYELAELRKDEDATRLLERSLQLRQDELTPEELQQKRMGWSKTIDAAMGEMALRQRRGALTQSDILDRPILRVLQDVLDREYQTATVASHSPGYRLKI
jgi:hypothetical protein